MFNFFFFSFFFISCVLTNVSLLFTRSWRIQVKKQVLDFWVSFTSAMFFFYFNQKYNTELSIIKNNYCFICCQVSAKWVPHIKHVINDVYYQDEHLKNEVILNKVKCTCHLLKRHIIDQNVRICRLSYYIIQLSKYLQSRPRRHQLSSSKYSAHSFYRFKLRNKLSDMKMLVTAVPERSNKSWKPLVSFVIVSIIWYF